MWYYSFNCKRTGPVSFEEIVRQIQAGVIRPETTVHEVGQKPFRAGQHPKLIQVFQMLELSQTPEENSFSDSTVTVPFTLNNPVGNPYGTPPSQNSPNSRYKRKKVQSQTPIAVIVVGCVFAMTLFVSIGFVLINNISSSKIASNNKHHQVTSHSSEHKQNSPVIDVSTPVTNVSAPVAEVSTPVTNVSDNEEIDITDPYECCSIAIEYEKKEEYDKAIFWLQKSAEQGNLDAQYMLGLHYFNGIGVVKDEDRGLELIIGAATKGDPDAIKFFNKYMQYL